MLFLILTRAYLTCRCNQSIAASPTETDLGGSSLSNILRIVVRDGKEQIGNAFFGYTHTRICVGILYYLCVLGKLELGYTMAGKLWRWSISVGTSVANLLVLLLATVSSYLTTRLRHIHSLCLQKNLRTLLILYVWLLSLLLIFLNTSLCCASQGRKALYIVFSVQDFCYDYEGHIDHSLPRACAPCAFQLRRWVSH